MKNKPFLFCFGLLLFSLTVNAEKKFDFNSQCLQAYKEIIKLKLDAGQQLITEEKRNNPDNLIPYFLENYIDFFELFFNEDPAVYKAKFANQHKRLALMEQGSAKSPFLKFTKAIINFQWAAVKIKFGERWDAGWDFRRSYLQVKANKEKFPGFLPNDMLFGSMQTVVGTIPDGYKWLASLLGMKGSVTKGMNLLTSFIQSNDGWVNVFKEEGIFYYTYLRYHVLNEREEVFAFIKQQQLDVVNNHLFAYMVANLAINSKQSGYALQVIKQRNLSPGYLSSPVWDMETGYALLNHLEKDAPFYLQRFLNSFKGKFYVKDVLQKLSWYYYLGGDIKKATDYRQLVKTKGNTETEADKQALKEAKSGQWTSVLLLKARLLNDGGYHREALQVLAGKSSVDFNREEEKVEFAYRLGRIYDDLEMNEEAIKNYLITMRTGEKRKEYFAARAAVQAGNIYERLGQKSTAIMYYQRCLDMGEHDFKDSLDQKAKAGIARCKGE